jgi:hypothetical protein
MKSGLSALSTPGQTPTGGMSWGTSWGQRGSAFGSPVMRLPSACDSRKVTGRVSGIATTGEQDCDLRLLLSKLFRRCRLAKERADRSLRARQRGHAQSVALGPWQHANADNLKGSFACRCYGCTGAPLGLPRLRPSSDRGTGLPSSRVPRSRGSAGRRPIASPVRKRRLPDVHAARPRGAPDFRR